MKESLENFLQQESDKKKIIVIYGPTGAWKTSMSIDIAHQLETEIISTDSRQIYRYMDIGTGKITLQEKQWIKHHMLDIIDPDQSYSVANFKEASIEIIEWLHEQNKIPLLVGWTWLYIDSLIYDFEVGWVPADLELRVNLEKELEEYWADALYKKLQLIDPEYAKELHPNNSQYVIRAIEVKLVTGKSKSEFRREKQLQYDVLFLTPDYGSRENLYNRINTRVEQMFEDWLESEVKTLVERWYEIWSFWMKSIGYSEFFPYFAWEYDLDTCKDLIKQHSRNYAKRQLTWFRKYGN